MNVSHIITFSLFYVTENECIPTKILGFLNVQYFAASLGLWGICDIQKILQKIWSLCSEGCCMLWNTPRFAINSEKFLTATLLLCGIIFFWQCSELEIQTCKQMLRVAISQEAKHILSCAEQTLSSLFNCIRHWLKSYFSFLWRWYVFLLDCFLNKTWV